MADIRLDNEITYGGAGSELLDAYVMETLIQMDYMNDYEGVKKILGFTKVPLVSPNQTYGAKYPGKGLRRIEESGTKKTREFGFGPKKGIYQEEFSEKVVWTTLITEWIKTAKTIKGAPESVQAVLVDKANALRELIMAFGITAGEEMCKVYTDGFDVTAANGAGSPCARDGLALFNAAHPVDTSDSTKGTWSNLQVGAPYASIAAGTTFLQEMIDKHKVMTFENGKKLKQPVSEGYDFKVSRERYVFWTQVLNDGSVNSGQGTNSEAKNQFRFKGNIINLIEFDALGELDVDDNAIGNTDMVFLCNSKYIMDSQALKVYSLYNLKVKSWMNEETDEHNTSVRGIHGNDHYYAEYGIVAWDGVTAS